MLGLERLLPTDSHSGAGGENSNVVKLSDDDINKIAHRAVELMRNGNNNESEKETDADADADDADADADDADADADDADADADADADDAE